MKSLLIFNSLVTFALTLAPGSALLKDTSISDVSSAPTKSEVTLSSEEYKRLASGAVFPRLENPYLIGPGESGTHPIFDYDNPAFISMVDKGSIPSAASKDDVTAEGSSVEEYARDYSKQVSFSADVGVDASQYAKIDVGAAFKTQEKGQLKVINEEKYESFTDVERIVDVQLDWKRNNPTDYFDATFIADFNAIEDINDAYELLVDYGTHVYQNYSLGGVLMFTRYSASQTSLEDFYKQNNISASLSTEIADAVSASTKGEAEDVYHDHYSNSSAVIGSRVIQRGGPQSEHLTIESLFTYRIQIGQYESTYPYQVWIRDLKEFKNLVPVNVSGDIAIWNLIALSSYHNAEKENLLKQAYEALDFKERVEGLLKRNNNPGLFEKVTCTTSRYEHEITSVSNSITLPSKSETTFTIDMDNFEYIDEDSFSFGITGSSKNRKNVVFNEEEGKLIIGENANGQEFKFVTSCFSVPIFELNIKVMDDNKYGGGYGTEDQPYIISNADHFKNYVDNAGTYESCAVIKEDIDMHGMFVSPGGSGGHDTPFRGKLLGNNHKVSNFNIRMQKNDKEYWSSIGLFGYNQGTIQDIVFENVKVYNDYCYVGGDNINIGIITGTNDGVIENVTTRGCSMRTVIQVNNNRNLNVGFIAGVNHGYIFKCFADASHMAVYSVDRGGKTNIGGIVGVNQYSSLKANIVRNSDFNSYALDNDAESNIGFICGFDKKPENVVNGVKSDYRWCLAYDNVYTNKKGNNKVSVGNILGNYEDSKLLAFSACYYSSKYGNAAVKGETATGCEKQVTLKFDRIGDGEKYDYFKADTKGFPIIK